MIPNSTELLSILRAHPVFASLTPSAVVRYFSGGTCEIVSFGVHEVAYSPSTERVRIGILLSGKARVETDAQALVKSLRSGELFGIANLYAEDEPFPTSIVTTSPAKILFLDGDAVKKLIEGEPEILKNYLAFQSRKIVYLNRKITTLTAGSAEKKLAVFLLDYEQDGIFIPPCPMSRLAELLGMGRASLYRAIDALCDEGLIEKQGKTILLQNKDALLRLI
ncbi:MAG: Crp/Fnr family transcriptional regulator [Clostridia bacterium]|nr:Crp/Fnr family transcriptional regulator [Clostridia bacterium]